MSQPTEVQSTPVRLVPRVAGCWFLAAVLGVAGVAILGGVAADHGHVATQLRLMAIVAVPVAAVTVAGVVYETRRALSSERLKPAPFSIRVVSGARYIATGLVLGLAFGGILAAQIGNAGTEASSGVLAQIGGVLLGIGVGSLLGGVWMLSTERHQGRSFWVEGPRLRGQRKHPAIYYGPKGAGEPRAARPR
ncbi:MAG: hypothetical protein ACRDJU_10425 [Actinomycetota bacterium]